MKQRPNPTTGTQAAQQMMREALDVLPPDQSAEIITKWLEHCGVSVGSMSKLSRAVMARQIDQY